MQKSCLATRKTIPLTELFPYPSSTVYTKLKPRQLKKQHLNHPDQRVQVRAVD